MSESEATPMTKAAKTAPNGGILKSPGSFTSKAVSIAEPAENVSPLMIGNSKQIDDSFQLDRPSPKQHRTKSSARLTGRPSTDRLSQSRQDSLEFLNELGYDSTTSTRPNSVHHQDGFRHRVHAWLQQEKTRRAAAKKRRKSKKTSGIASGDEHDEVGENTPRRGSDASSGGDTALEQLQEILASMSFQGSSRRGNASKRHSISRLLRRTSTAPSSDTEYLEGDALVPTCEAILDNSKTLAYSGGVAEGETPEGDDRPPLNRATSTLNKEAWKTFKYEIVRLTHTLRLKGWRHVPMELSNHIDVERLSGALTNAVYVVSPPKDLPPKDSKKAEGDVPVSRKPPPKLLLRIYGSNVDHLIDRESELQILRRLARKRIGPRLLGTFTNGRFEEFLHARALNPQDLHDPSMSKQIAKRMRELHEGIDLLPEERRDDPFVWRNIDKWMQRCSQIVGWIDTQAQHQNPNKTKQHPFVCGTKWSTFQDVLDRYRKWLYDQYGGLNKLKQQLVFAHNDTQYGNLLRMVPSGESPLLLPANQHKQLVVIDFEYASANLPGLEFANHFSEWCYNYHDATAPHACNTRIYPTLEEQKRFIRAYVTHRPAFGPNTPSYSNQQSVPGTPGLPQTPSLGPAPSSLSTSLISNFMLDSRFPQASNDAEKADEDMEQECEKEVMRLVKETRMWRLANSAQWVMWGVMQAKIPDLPDFDDPTQSAAIAAGPSTCGKGMGTDLDQEGKDLAEDPSDPDLHKAGILPTLKNCLKLGKDMGTDPLDQEGKDLAEDISDKRPDPEEEGNGDEEFDYLSYTWERAMFFWGDAVILGMIGLEELPEIVRKDIKLVDY